jgi:hypothetical protein
LGEDDLGSPILHDFSRDPRRAEKHLDIERTLFCRFHGKAGLDKIWAFSRHRTIATLMIYVDEHDRQRTLKTLRDLVASTLTS